MQTITHPQSLTALKATLAETATCLDGLEQSIRHYRGLRELSFEHNDLASVRLAVLEELARHEAILVATAEALAAVTPGSGHPWPLGLCELEDAVAELKERRGALVVALAKHLPKVQ